MKKHKPVYLPKVGAPAKKKRKKRISPAIFLLSGAVIVSVFIVWIAASRFGDPDESSQPTESVSAASSIAPAESSSMMSTASSGIDTATREMLFSDLQSEISAYLDRFEGRIGVSYINLENNETIGINETLPFVAASSIKLALAAQYYKSMAEGEFQLTDMLTYDSRAYPIGDKEPGTGVIINGPDGAQFSARRTAQLAITISDNCATNMMIRKLGGIDQITPELYAISQTVKYREPVSYTDYKGAIISGRHRVSALDLALYAVDFYELWSQSKEDFQPLMDDLQNTVFDFGIHKKLPPSVKVAHKIGTNYDWKTENDVGIVFADEPFVICVTTEGRDQAAGRAASADIAALIYSYITDLYDTD